MKEEDQNLPADVNTKVSVLDKIYGFAINGIPRFDKSLDSVVNSYVTKARTTDEAINNFVRNHKIKCGTTGFVTGLGGILTLPIAIPADVASSLYIEMRMIAGIAMIRGYNIYDDQVKTLIYLCLVGNTIGDVVKQVGIKVGERLVVKKLLPKLTREVISKINRSVAFRLITKGGSKGLLNIGKMVPIIGGLIGVAWNVAEVTIFAKHAKKVFNENR
ncbi:MAG: EcsC family protein [Bacteroides sp.]|nr:EcsC family protein [Bacteroides sp.]